MIVVAIIVLVLIGFFIVMFGLHYKRKLPPAFYNALGRKQWKPVLGNEEYPVTEEDEKKKHPSIVKNGSASNGTNGTKATDVSPMSDDANVNPDLTTVTWTKETNGKEVEVEMKDNKFSDEPTEEEEEKKPLQV